MKDYVIIIGKLMDGFVYGTVVDLKTNKVGTKRQYKQEFYQFVNNWKSFNGD